MIVLAADLILLWQLALSLLGAAAVAALALAVQRRQSWAAASPAFWWSAIALAVAPALLAHALPSAWTLPADGWRWVDLGDAAGASMSAQAEKSTAGPRATLSLGDALLAGWLAGCLLALLRQLRGHWQLHRLLARCHRLSAQQLPGAHSRRLARVLALQGIQLFGCGDAVSPFAHRRRIVLPLGLLARLDDPQCWLLMRHEATHLRLRDPLWQGVLAFVLALHWFNPAIRLLADRLRLATELRCDARALGRRKHMRRAYADAYLQALRMSATRTLACPAAAFSPQDQGHHKMRIGNILSSPARNGKRSAGALLLSALCVGAALTAAHAAGLGNSPAVDGQPPAFRGPVIDGQISSPFGKQRPELSADPHRGIDLKAPRGTAVRAPADGVVITAEAPFAEAPRYGSVVIIDHGGGWRTLYAHLDSIAVKRGDRVRAGDTLGGLGSTGVATGPHVHVEVHHHGERVDPALLIAELTPTP